MEAASGRGPEEQVLSTSPERFDRRPGHLAMSAMRAEMIEGGLWEGGPPALKPEVQTVSPSGLDDATVAAATYTALASGQAPTSSASQVFARLAHATGGGACALSERSIAASAVWIGLEVPGLDGARASSSSPCFLFVPARMSSARMHRVYARDASRWGDSSFQSPGASSAAAAGALVVPGSVDALEPALQQRRIAESKARLWGPDWEEQEAKQKLRAMRREAKARAKAAMDAGAAESKEAEATIDAEGAAGTPADPWGTPMSDVLVVCDAGADGASPG